MNKKIYVGDKYAILLKKEINREGRYRLNADELIKLKYLKENEGIITLVIMLG